MALTREAPLSRPSRVAPLRARALRLLLCFAPALLSACAQAPDGSELTPYTTTTFDASRSPVTPGPFEDDIDSGSSAPIDPGPVQPSTPFDAGAAFDAGGARDTGPASTPMDANTNPPTPVVDSSRPPPVDAAPPRPVDAGTDARPPDPPVNAQMCAATPAYPTTTSCAKCTCMKCAAQVAACYASTDSAKNTQCAAVQACAEQNKCVGTTCYCGDSPLCLNPSGACRMIIQTAAGSDQLSQITAVRDDPNSALGRAALIGVCQEMSCRTECGL